VVRSNRSNTSRQYLRLFTGHCEFLVLDEDATGLCTDFVKDLRYLVGHDLELIVLGKEINVYEGGEFIIIIIF
jgi:hypothetical protein